MSAKLIDGKAIAATLRARLADEIRSLKQAPGLAVVLVGDDPASQVYVASKAKQTVECGMNSFEHKLPADAAQETLMALVDQLNADAAVEAVRRLTGTGRVAATTWGTA